MSKRATAIFHENIFALPLRFVYYTMDKFNKNKELPFFAVKHILNAKKYSVAFFPMFFFLLNIFSKLWGGIKSSLRKHVDLLLNNLTKITY